MNIFAQVQISFNSNDANFAIFASRHSRHPAKVIHVYWRYCIDFVRKLIAWKCWLAWRHHKWTLGCVCCTMLQPMWEFLIRHSYTDLSSVKFPVATINNNTIFLTVISSVRRAESKSELINTTAFKDSGPRGPVWYQIFVPSSTAECCWWQQREEEQGGCRVLISELPWRAAIAVSRDEGSFAKVRQILAHSVLIGLSGLQNRQGMQWGWSSELSSRPPHWGYLMAHATKTNRPHWDTQGPTPRSHDRLHCKASTWSEAALCRSRKIAPRPAVCLVLCKS